MTTPSLPLAAPEEVGLSTERLTRLSDVLRGEIDRGRVPGTVTLVARRGKVGFFEALGARDPVSGAPMHKDTIFRVYSMTKPIVSVAAMMLWEEGQFLLNDPIAKYRTPSGKGGNDGEDLAGCEARQPQRALKIEGAQGTLLALHLGRPCGRLLQGRQGRHVDCPALQRRAWSPLPTARHGR